MKDNADAEAEKIIDGAHPLRVSSCKVIIYSDYMNAGAFKRIEIHRQGSNKCFAFACFHLCDFTFVKRYAAEKLDVKVAHLQGPL